MKLFTDYTEICVCPNCNYRLHYRPYSQNIYSGGPFCCGHCGHDVTEAIYGNPKPPEPPAATKQERE